MRRGKKFRIVAIYLCTTCTDFILRALTSVSADDLKLGLRPNSRADLRHVRGVRPNRVAKFRGPQFWTLKIPCELTCQFERLWCLDYGANADINAATRCIL